MTTTERKVNFVKHGRRVLIQVRSDEYVRWGFVLVDPKTLHESEGGFDFGNAEWSVISDNHASISNRARTVARFYRSGKEAFLPEALNG